MKIKEIAKFVRKEKKVDDYYALNACRYPKKSLRVRRSGEDVVVNFKGWINYKNGIHAKKEVEFKVSDLKGFFYLLKDFGFKKWLRKEKITELYKTKDGVSIELSYVKKLGWFVEIEIICAKSKIVPARRRIAELRNIIGFKKVDIEKSGYTKDLWDLKKK